MSNDTCNLSSLPDFWEGQSTAWAARVAKLQANLKKQAKEKKPDENLVSHTLPV